MYSIDVNYDILIETFEESKGEVTDTDMKAKLAGVLSVMRTFDYYYGLKLSYLILSQTDNLSKSLQAAKLSASEGHQLVNMTVNTLETKITDQKFTEFWDMVTSDAIKHNIDEPLLPRKRKRPAKVKDFFSPLKEFSNEVEYYKYHYFNALNVIIKMIKERFYLLDKEINT